MSETPKKVKSSDECEILQDDSDSAAFDKFVINKTIAGSRRFGLIILIEPPANRYDAYWIYRDKDLSSVSLNRHSGNFYLAGPGDEGVNLNCDIKWDRSERRWTCKGPLRSCMHSTMSILIAEDNVAQLGYLREILEREFQTHTPVQAVLPNPELISIEACTYS